MKNIHTIKTLICLLLMSLGLLTASMSYAETAVIVHPSNSSELSQKNIQRIFLGKLKVFPGGEDAIPLEHPTKSDIRQQFNTSVLKKDFRQIKSYWGRLIFTGKGLPPKEVSTPDQIKKLVATNPNTISYIDALLVDETVKVVLKF